MWVEIAHLVSSRRNREDLIDFTLLVFIIFVEVTVDNAYNLATSSMAASLSVDAHECFHVPLLQLHIVLAFASFRKLLLRTITLLLFILLGLVRSYYA